MCDDIRLEKVTTQTRFDNSSSKFYHKLIPKAAKIKRISTLQQREGNESLRKCRHNINEANFWACDVIVHKAY